MKTPFTKLFRRAILFGQILVEAVICKFHTLGKDKRHIGSRQIYNSERLAIKSIQRIGNLATFIAHKFALFVYCLTFLKFYKETTAVV